MLPSLTPGAAETVDRESFKILVISSLRFPIAEPFAGGLESHTWALATGLRARGHSVLVAGAVGSDPSVVGHEFGRLPAGRPGERADTMENDEVRAAESGAFHTLMDDVRAGLLGSFDLVHNNSLYSLPVEQAATLPHPMITTLHTPPLPWSERVLGARRHRDSDFVAVSASTARSWAPLLFPRVVHNGIDTDVWRPGPGGRDAVWSGRLVAEKAPHLAIELAHAAGLGLTLAGPIGDPAYFAAEVAPRLGGDIRYAGHLSRDALATLVGSSAVALATPVWPEPFGMVVAEAMACGTPVVALARGGVPEIVDRTAGRLLPPPAGDVLTPADLWRARAAMDDACRLDRTAVREHAVRRLSLDAMLSGYEDVYRDVVHQES
ncbi:MAG: glycosyltransferase [Nakamurella sp.]